MSEDRRPLAILLMGPTASGKTDLAVDLVRRMSCDIVSVDSAMVYRGMDIGTAKPGPDVLAEAPHRLIDILDPVDAYSTARFRVDALAEMGEIAGRGRLPLLVGGTMLYFRGLQQGIAPLPDADPAVRRVLEDEAARLGWPALHTRLSRLDPESAARIHPNDPQRIQRALEVQAIAGVPMSELIRAGRVGSEQGGGRGGELPYRLLKLVRAPAERATLHRRIETRFRAMLDLGLVGEVESLWARGDLTEDLPSMRCVGYRQVLKFIQGEYSYGEMVQRGIYATRQLAKRQMTWLRSESDCLWLWDQPSPLGPALEAIGRALSAVDGYQGL